MDFWDSRCFFRVRTGICRSGFLLPESVKSAAGFAPQKADLIRDEFLYV